MAQRGLERTTVAEELAGRLSHRILGGSLPPGTPLREERVAESYETTRTTVREALRLLERGGLVIRETHRGSHVTVVEREDLEDIITMRRAVEPQVVRLAVERTADLSPLYRLADELESTARAGEWARYGDTDIRFHTELVRTAGSARLVDFFGTTLRLLKLAMLSGDEAAPPARDLPAHVGEHRRILRLIDAGDTEGAAWLMTEHLEAARENLLSRVADN